MFEPPRRRPSSPPPGPRRFQPYRLARLVLLLLSCAISLLLLIALARLLWA